jgi:hypothetical protein
LDAEPQSTVGKGGNEMMKRLVLLGLVAMLSGCATMYSTQTEAERKSGYTYVPIDPFAVKTIPGDSCSENKQVNYGSLLQSLPDNAVRMLIEQISTSGTVTYGPAKMGAKGESYRVTIDYINADTVNITFWIAKMMRKKEGIKNNWIKDEDWVTVSILETPPIDAIPNSEIYYVCREKPDEKYIKDYEEFNIPVYIGIGLRVSATVEVVGANANISGIGIIGAEAEAERLRGSLIVQTLGVNGKSIAAALPIQSELNRTTAQNAISAVSSIKALLYNEDETVVSPRVVGIYLPFPGGKALVNRLISELSKKRVEWPRPCVGSGKNTSN